MALLAFSFSAGAQTNTYKVDPDHTSIVFKVNHMGFSTVYGMIGGADGKIVVDEKAPEKSTFEISARLDSINTMAKKRDDHLKGPDFFNVKQYPTIVLKSKSVKKTGDKYDVTADLTLHGVTKPVSFVFTPGKTGKDMAGKIRTSGETVLKIKRTDFGMNFMSKPGEVGNDVEVLVSVEGTKI
jgi:polyisoprenoid-binding protein YceI